MVCRYKWVEHELSLLNPQTDWERMVSLYVCHCVPEFALAMMIYPGTMRMMQPRLAAATLAHTSKLETKPQRRFQDGNYFLMAWMADGPSSTAGRTAAQQLNRIHLSVARRTPHLPANFDDTDDFIYPLVFLATFGDRLLTSLGLPGLGLPMKTAWHLWAQALFRLLQRESGPLTDESFPADWDAMIEFALEFESRSYEPTESGHRVATAMMDFFATQWFAAPLRPFGRDLTRYLAGERVCRLHRIGWMSPRRERLVRAFLRAAFIARRFLPDYRVPLPERLRRRWQVPTRPSRRDSGAESRSRR